MLTTNATEKFIGLDLGDNYPCGIHPHKFTDSTIHSRVISSYKTLNGPEPQNIGLVTVIEDFQNVAGSGAEVSDDLVVTDGLVETGGFYSFGGG